MLPMPLHCTSVTKEIDIFVSEIVRTWDDILLEKLYRALTAWHFHKYGDKP